MNMKKVWVNEKLIGKVNVEETVKKLGLELEIRYQEGDYLIDVSLDDNYEINIDYVVDDELVGGSFVEVEVK